MHASALSDKSLPNLSSLHHFILFCVCSNNEIEKEFGEVNTKKISLVSNLRNFFPKGFE